MLQAVQAATCRNMSGEEADDFEKAILIVFAQNGLVDPSLKVSTVPEGDLDWITTSLASE